MNWTVQILDSRGNICTRINPRGKVEDLVKGFDRASDADRWCDRRLLEGASDWYGTIDHATLNVHTIVQRQDSIGRIMKQPSMPALHIKAVNKTLGFGIKAHQDRVVFSGG